MTNHITVPNTLTLEQLNQQKRQLADLLQKVRGKEELKVANLIAAAITQNPNQRWQTCKALIDEEAYVVYVIPEQAEVNSNLPVLRESAIVPGSNAKELERFAQQYRTESLYRGLSRKPLEACVEVRLRGGACLELNIMPLPHYLKIAADNGDLRLDDPDVIEVQAEECSAEKPDAKSALPR